MEQFYKDKSKLFECKLAVEGADLNNTQARLVLQFENKTNLLFYGEVDSDGKCSVVVPPLKENSSLKGKAILEVIADSTYFESWEDKFEVEASKKVVVERIETKQPLITSPKVNVVKESTNIPTINIIENFGNYLSKNGISITNLKQNQSKLPNLLENYIKLNKPLKEDIRFLIKNVGECVKYLK